jgi:hypothetical protein
MGDVSFSAYGECDIKQERAIGNDTLIFNLFITTKYLTTLIQFYLVFKVLSSSMLLLPKPSLIKLETLIIFHK